MIYCQFCKAPTHSACSKVGLNLGRHNYFCKRCHDKKTAFRRVLNSVLSDDQKSASNHLPNSSTNLDSYANIDDLNSILKTKTVGDILIAHINSVSLQAHFDSISSLINNKMHKPPDVICFSETRLKDDKIDYQANFVDLPNYELFYDNSPTCAGGVAVYVRTNVFDFKLRSDLKFQVADCESVFIEISVSPKNSNHRASRDSFIVGGVYRHPRTTTTEITLFVEEMYKKLEVLVNKNIPLMILGDINIDVSQKDDDNVLRYVNMLSSIGCENLIDINTRFSAKSRSTLDHILTNVDQERILSGVLNYPITDHLPIFAVVKNQFDPNLTKKDENSNNFWRFF